MEDDMVFWEVNIIDVRVMDLNFRLETREEISLVVDIGTGIDSDLSFNHGDHGHLGTCD